MVSSRPPHVCVFSRAVSKSPWDCLFRRLIVECVTRPKQIFSPDCSDALFLWGISQRTDSRRVAACQVGDEPACAQAMMSAKVASRLWWSQTLAVTGGTQSLRRVDPRSTTGQAASPPADALLHAAAADASGASLGCRSSSCTGVGSNVKLQWCSAAAR